MGLFKRRDDESRQNWIDDAEMFANYYGDLQLDVESLVREVLEGNYEVSYQLWDKWDDHAKSVAFYYVLGYLEGFYGELKNVYGEQDEY